MRKILLGIVLVIGLVGVFVAYGKIMNDQKRVLSVSTYEECAAAGFPVLASYPGRCITDDGRSFTQDIGNELEMREEILIENPRPNQVINEFLEIKGKARGSWFYEGMFTGELVDGNDKRLAQFRLDAEGEWMTDAFVSFTGSKDIDTPTTEDGFLYLRNANPSGLAENDKELIIPVKFLE
jgi:hypothetical protein